MRASSFVCPRPHARRASALSSNVPDAILVHGTCVALEDQAVLLRGAPGSGKSDLALRFLSRYSDLKAVLVADDQVHLSLEQDQVIATPPATIAGQLEVRGVGIITLPHLARAVLSLIINLKPSAELERLPPEPLPTEVLLGVPVPLAALDPFQLSSPEKLKLLLSGNI